MKKLFFVVTLLCAIWWLAKAGPEPVLQSDKTVMQTEPQVEFFRGHEWDLDLWGTYAFSGQPGRNNVPNDDPFTPDLDPEILVSTAFATTVRRPRNLNPNEHVDLGLQQKDTFLGKDEAWGGGVDVKYFWNRYLGIGVEGFIVNARSQPGGAGLGTLTARYPMGRIAPYIFGGGGALAGGSRVDHFFNEVHHFSDGGALASEREFYTDETIRNSHTYFDGQLGAGFEVRMTPHIGFMADFAWNFIAGGEGDGHRVVRSPGGNIYGANIFPLGGGAITPVATFPNNRANEVVPGPNSDNKEFGMVRFGLTLSY